MIRVLSIDGGGLRGAIALHALADIELRTNKPIHDSFDLIAGTSTGALIAIGLSYSPDGVNRAYSISDLLNIYEKKGEQIFPPPTLGSARFLRSLIHRRYSNRGLRGVLVDLFGESRIDKCLTPVLIPAYDLRSNQPIVFSSRQSSLPMGEAYNPRIVDVLMSTTAAPTYFASYKFKMTALHAEKRLVQAVDGGLYANNPTLLALKEVLGADSKDYYGKDTTREDIYSLSLGTGEYYVDYAARTTERWGVVQWGLQLFDVISQSSSSIYDSLVRDLVLPPNNYLRINLDIEQEIHSRMDRYRRDSFSYWHGLYNTQVIGDAVTDDHINQFLGRSGLT